MKEYITEGIVLALYPHSETDRVADFFTKEFGRIETRVVGGRKILSKFSPHLSPGAYVMARLVKKNVYTLTDVMSHSRRLYRHPRLRAEVLSILFLIRALVPSANPDPKL